MLRFWRLQAEEAKQRRGPNGHECNGDSITADHSLRQICASPAGHGLLRIALYEFSTFIAFLALFTRRMSNPFRASGGVAQ